MAMPSNSTRMRVDVLASPSLEKPAFGNLPRERVLHTSHPIFQPSVSKRNSDQSQTRKRNVPTTIETIGRTRKSSRSTMACRQEPNATGKPHRSAKHGGNQQAQLVGVGLTEKLGW